MKRKHFILLVVAVAIVGLGLWLFMRPTVVVPEKAAETPILAKADSAPKIVAPPTIAPPVMPQAAKSAQTTPATSVNTSPESADSQADLKTSIPDIVRLLRAGDIATFRETYDPPDKLDPQVIQQIRAGQLQSAANAALNPGLQQILQRMNDKAAQSYEALENQTPTYNDAGDEATYVFTVPDGQEQPTSKTFVKIDGKWYIKWVNPADTPVVQGTVSFSKGN